MDIECDWGHRWRSPLSMEMTRAAELLGGAVLDGGSGITIFGEASALIPAWGQWRIMAAVRMTGQSRQRVYSLSKVHFPSENTIKQVTRSSVFSHLECCPAVCLMLRNESHASCTAVMTRGAREASM